MFGELKDMHRFRGSMNMNPKGVVVSSGAMRLPGSASVKRIVNLDGFALPSVLMLVSILTTLIFSLLLVQYFDHTAVLREVARLKADVATQNGVVWAAACKITGSDSIYFDDGTKAIIYTCPWGLYRFVLSRGISGRTVGRHAALLGQRQTGLFNNALVYFNPQHQLVFAGEAQVVGDVQVGSNGATLGVLEDMKSLPAFPVTGTIENDASFDGFDFPELQTQIEIFDSLLRAAADNASSATWADILQTPSNGNDLEKIAKHNLTQVVLEGNQDFFGKLVRHGGPLRIIVLGSVTFSIGATVYGPVQILSTGPMTIPSEVHIEYPILYSQTSIEVLSSSECKAQLISPKITMDKNARLDYPSSLVSWVSSDSVNLLQEMDAKTEARTLTLLENAVVEGVVIMNNRPVPLEDPELIVLVPTSKVIGVVYCGEDLTFDGTVIGTVITNDFYFYESPTRYFGWIRDGTINRTLLPEAYLTPVGLTEADIEFDILDWI